MGRGLGGGQGSGVSESSRQRPSMRPSPSRVSAVSEGGPSCVIIKSHLNLEHGSEDPYITASFAAVKMSGGGDAAVSLGWACI